jgi:hypothetical protein
MKTLGFAALLSGTLLACSAHAGIIINVTPSLAPNAYGSPSFAAYTTNADNALYTGGSSAGTPGTPTYYQAQSNVTSREAVVTGFPSWLGQLNPGATVGPAFANEYGNRMTFGLSAVGTYGTMFSVSQLSFNAVSNDPGDYLGFGYASGYNYTGALIGVLYGADGSLGGGDDTFITSGADTQLVNAIIYRGSGNSNPAYCTGICDAADQEANLEAAANIPGLTQFTGTYSITTSGDLAPQVASGSGTFNITGAGGVPEPATWAMMLVGFGGLGAVLRQRRGRVALAA